MPTRRDDAPALAFDLFGTVLDWRYSIAAECRRLAWMVEPAPDWEALAVAWSKEYGKSVARMTSWANLDEMLMDAFARIAHEFGLDGLKFPELLAISTAWSRLQPWPDAREGLIRLQGRYRLAALTNANVAMIRDLSWHAGLPWDYAISAEAVRCYKPCPEVYRHALRVLKAEPGQVVMVAAHTFDLNAAHALSFLTALIERPSEPGSNREGLDHEADLIVPDIATLADALLVD